MEIIFIAGVLLILLTKVSPYELQYKPHRIAFDLICLSPLAFALIRSLPPLLDPALRVLSLLNLFLISIPFAVLLLTFLQRFSTSHFKQLGYFTLRQAILAPTALFLIGSAVGQTMTFLRAFRLPDGSEIAVSLRSPHPLWNSFGCLLIAYLAIKYAQVLTSIRKEIVKPDNTSES